jgi:hypothetical protein
MAAAPSFTSTGNPSPASPGSGKQIAAAHAISLPGVGLGPDANAEPIAGARGDFRPAAVAVVGRNAINDDAEALKKAPRLSGLVKNSTQFTD